MKIPGSRPPERPAAATVYPSKTPPPAKPGGGPAAPGPSGATIPALAGIPQDRLSASIVSFARFFSLPLDGGLAAKIRRLVLRAERAGETGPGQAGPRPADPRPAAEKSGRAAPENGSPPPRGSQNFREALSLAALAAEHKGVELSPRALAEYAAALDPAESADPDAGGGRGGDGDGNQDGRQDERGGPPGDGASRGSPAWLKLKVSDALEKSPLPALLNSIPGKDGRRWIVLPFSFSGEGALYKVSMRILLYPHASKTAAERLALDIVRFDPAENRAAARADREDSAGGKTGRRRLFILDRGNPARLDCRLRPFPEGGALRRLSRELSELLQIPGEHISIRNLEDSSDFMADSRINVLPSVNEEV